MDACVKKVLGELRRVTGNNHVRWPVGIELKETSEGYAFLLSKEAVSANVQTNAGAFEGWALALKAWISKDIQIQLDWDAASQEDRHYQRFLYRVIKLCSATPWISVAASSKKHLEGSKVLLPCGKHKPGPFLVNAPCAQRSSKDPMGEFSEHRLEILFTLGTDLLAKSGCGGQEVRRQLPVGIFRDAVSSDNYVFTGKKSAIDLWSYDLKKGAVYLYELKGPKNNHVGAISELMFYAYVISDVLNDRFTLSSSESSDTEFSACGSVRAFLLTAAQHPLLNKKGVFQIVNDAFSDACIQFGALEYSLSEEGIRSVERKY